MKIQLLLFCLMANTLTAQQMPSTDSLLGKYVNPKFEQQKLKDQREWGMDFHCLGTSIHWVKKMEKLGNVYVGGELGMLPDAFKWVMLSGNHYQQENTAWVTAALSPASSINNEIHQLWFFHGLVRFKKENRIGWLDVDAGIRYAQFFNSDNLYRGKIKFYGLFVKPSFGRPKLKVGVRLAYGFMVEEEVQEYVMIASPFIRVGF